LSRATPQGPENKPPSPWIGPVNEHRQSPLVEHTASRSAHDCVGMDPVR
jgi:hypothetical protein